MNKKTAIKNLAKTVPFLHRHPLAALYCLLMAITTSATFAQDDFLVQINLKHGHLGKVFFGCKSGATEQFDRKLDIMAPPAGIATGYTAFTLKGTNLFLYKDLRPHAPTITWQFQATVYEDKTITLTWDPKSLSRAYSFKMLHNDKPQDMHKTSTLTIPKTTIIQIIATQTK